MITFSEHVRIAMEKHGISEEEVREVLEHGTCIIREIVDGERRYGNELLKKGRIIIVIYTYRDDATRIITCYGKRRKQWPEYIGLNA